MYPTLPGRFFTTEPLGKPLVISFESEKYEFSSFALFQGCLTSLGCLHFQVDFRISWSVSAKMITKILTGIATDFY